MGEVKVRLSDEVEAAFRKKAMEKFGYGKGSLSLAAEEAFGEWAVARQKTAEMGKSLSKLRGVLKHVKKSSVELQHELGGIRETRYARRRYLR